MANPNEGFVYLILEMPQQPGQDAAFYKVGQCRDNCQNRVGQLQTGNPRRLRLIGQHAVRNMTEAERWLHRQLANYTSTLGGGTEWFYVQKAHVNNVLIANFNEMIRQYGIAIGGSPQHCFLPTYEPHELDNLLHN